MPVSTRNAAEGMEDVMSCLTEANVYVQALEWAMAEECYANALDDAERNFGEHHIITLKCLECTAR